MGILAGILEARPESEETHGEYGPAARPLALQRKVVEPRMAQRGATMVLADTSHQFSVVSYRLLGAEDDTRRRGAGNQLTC